jgi:hypothetical protein
MSSATWSKAGVSRNTIGVEGSREEVLGASGVAQLELLRLRGDGDAERRATIVESWTAHRCDTEVAII